jgi:drug/metabolite transporter (DMT)-like permease
MSTSASASRLFLPIGPGIAAATSLGISDVLAKVVLASGSDVLTMLSFRGVIGVAFVATWFGFGPKPQAADARVRWFSLANGVLFAGVTFCLFKAIEAIDVPTAVLSYFVYPLLTGLGASLLRLEPWHWRGALCAVAAFLGLAVMIGAHPEGAVFVGVAYALGAALCRTALLLVTRAFLIGADARVTTWYTQLATMFIFLVILFATQTWNAPQTGDGWAALVGLSVATSAGVLFIFMSTVRIGPFRTALIMNLEPLIVMVLSALVLAEVITPLQGLGSAIMLAALIAFQVWR